jgi:ribosome-associated protein
MIEVIPSLFVDESEIQIDFIRSSGPGGQNVNKVSTAAQLRFDVENSPSLPSEVKYRLAKLAGSRMTNEGILIIDAHQYRTQEQNRADAMLRLMDLLRQASQKPKPRKHTRPSASARAARLDEKRHRGDIKRLRGNTASEND